MADDIEPQSDTQEIVQEDNIEQVVNEEENVNLENEEKVDEEQTEKIGEECLEEERDHVALADEELIGEGEEVKGDDEEVEEEQQKEPEKNVEEEKVEEEEEEGYIEEPPPDPSAPLNLTDSKEALKSPFELRPDQLGEVEKLWELYQNYTPAYTDIHDYITEKELVYMLKSLLLMTYTEEQLQELIQYCVRPPDPLGHITYEQFLKMVTIRQRDFPIEEELRSALQVMDPQRTGQVERENLKDVLTNLGSKMPAKLLDNFIKEVDMSNDGQIGIEDVVGTMCIDLNKEDLMLLMSSLNPDTGDVPQDSDET